MFICNDCNHEFETPSTYEERHGLDTPPYETLRCCPACGSPDYYPVLYCEHCGAEFIDPEGGCQWYPESGYYVQSACLCPDCHRRAASAELWLQTLCARLPTEAAHLSTELRGMGHTSLHPGYQHHPSPRTAWSLNVLDPDDQRDLLTILDQVRICIRHVPESGVCLIPYHDPNRPTDAEFSWSDEVLLNVISTRVVPGQYAPLIAHALMTWCYACSHHSPNPEVGYPCAGDAATTLAYRVALLLDPTVDQPHVEEVWVAPHLVADDAVSTLDTDLGGVSALWYAEQRLLTALKSAAEILPDATTTLRIGNKLIALTNQQLYSLIYEE